MNHYAENCMKYPIFPILAVMVMLVLSPLTAHTQDNGCLVQEGSSPSLFFKYDRVFVRDGENHLREWRREWQDTDAGEETEEKWFADDLSCLKESATDLDCPKGYKLIMSNPAYFREEKNKMVESRDKDGNPSQKEEFEGWMGHLFARGTEGHLLEWRRIITVGSPEAEPEPIPDKPPVEQPSPPEEHTPVWKWWLSDLTAETGNILIAGSPSRRSDNESEFVGTFFVATPENHLLRWSLPALSKTVEDWGNERLWSVEDVTVKWAGSQLSAGDPILTPRGQVFTRSPEGHLIHGIGFEVSDIYQIYQVTDLTQEAGVSGQTIVGNPAVLQWRIPLDPDKEDDRTLVQHVFARDASGHLREWWRKREPSEWVAETSGGGWQVADLSTQEGQTIKGDPILYITYDRTQIGVQAIILNVVARGQNHHLLKWSMTDANLTRTDASNSKFTWQLTDRAWQFEDLTLLGGQLMAGDPTGNFFMFGTYRDGEHLFARGENGHLLRWWRQWRGHEGKEESWTYWSPIGNWQFQDLSESCQSTNGIVSTKSQGLSQETSDKEFSDGDPQN